MQPLTGTPFASACRIVLLAALLAGAAADADAKGRRSSSASSSSSGKTTGNKADNEKENGGFNPSIVIRRSSSSSSSSSSASPAGAGIPFAPIDAGAAPPQPDPEEEARRAARQAAQDRLRMEKAAAERAAFEKAEADRLAAEKAAADRAALRAAEERAEAARVAAAQEKKRREDAAVAADVDRVLQRALADYPVLKTPAGDGLFRAILERQKTLQARGMYPSIAMVEAIADHAHLLAPREKPQALPLTQVSATPASDDAKTFGGCRWATPTRWACN